MFYIEGVSKTMVTLIQTVYQFLWGDLITLPLPGGAGISFSLLVLLLIPTGIYFTLRTRFLSLRLFKDMLRVTLERKDGETTALSACQTLVVSTATRVGMGNLVGVVAAISAGWSRSRILDVGHSPSGFHYRRLLRLRWLSFIRKRILFTADTGEVLPTICINFSRKIRSRPAGSLFLCSLQYQA